MAEYECEWVVVRNEYGVVSCPVRNEWDRLTILACLSNDPRTMKELAIAWTRYRPDQPLMKMDWRTCRSLPDGRTPGVWIDLTRQELAWWDGESQMPPEEGSYSRGEEEGSSEEYLWVNTPPWWQTVQRQTLEDFHRLPSQKKQAPLDFREVLYGRPFARDIAQRVRQAHADARRQDEQEKVPELTKAFDEGSNRSLEDMVKSLRRFDDALNEVTHAAIRHIHLQWLTSPRPDLAGRIPREYLHEHRQWKEDELHCRRSHWSIARKAPPPVPLTSHLFRYGPMGNEEVTMYFQLCRLSIVAAWRWQCQDPYMPERQLVRKVERFVHAWLDALDSESPTMSRREIVHNDRQLMPRLASIEPLDCDCPICRLQATDSHLFGPAFSMVDGMLLEFEGEFAFSLCEKRDEWEVLCGDMMDSESGLDDLPFDADEAIDDDSTELDEEEGAYNQHAAGNADETDQQARRPEIVMITGSLGLDGNPKPSDSLAGPIWKSSMVSSSVRNPEFSLFAIGARLAEVILELKRLGAQRHTIDSLNSAFDQLSCAIRAWLVSEATRSSDTHTAAIDGAVESMIAELESVAHQYTELTSQSADLQSLVHHWQRELAVK